MTDRGLLLVGNFLSSQSRTRSVCEDLSERLADNGHAVIRTSSKVRRGPRLLDMVSTVLRRRCEYKVAYVEVYSGLAFLWAEVVVFLLSCLRKRIILALHGGGLVEFARAKPNRMARLLRRGHKVITPSLFLQAGLQPYCASIGYLPNAIEVKRYPFRVRCNPEPKLVWLRAFHSVYAPDAAVRALGYLLKDIHEATLVMVGPDKKDGSLPRALELARRLDIASHISIVGPVSRSAVPEWLGKGDIFLNTTLCESFGVSVVEAALVGLPIVTTDVGELPLLWEHNNTALLVPQHDPLAIANAVRRILAEPGLAEHLSNHARLRAEAFDWSLVLPQWEQLFIEAAGA